MALPKYTDPAVQNQTQDNATDDIDSVHAEPTTTGKNKSIKKEKIENTKNKIKSYKEGNKDDTSFLDEGEESVEDRTDYSFDEDDDEFGDAEFYGKGL
jgi:hypothetical protein